MKIKKIIFIITSLILLFVIGYFIYNIKRVSSLSYSLDDFKARSFESSDKNTTIIFSTDGSVTMKLDGSFYYIVNIELVDNILTFEHENSSYSFLIIDDKTIYYSPSNLYLYLKDKQ
jgi:hypothetical protein